MIIERPWTLQYTTISSLTCPFHDRTPWVTCHGWLDNAASFLPLMQSYPTYPWCSIDLPGHGHSSHPPIGTHPHWIDYIDCLYNLSTQLEAETGHKQFIWLGHSLGASILCLFAAAFPERVQRLILFDFLGTLNTPPETLVSRVRDATLSFFKFSQSTPIYAESIDILFQARWKHTPLPEAVLRPLVERNIQQDSEGYRWRTDPRLKIPPSLGLTEEQNQTILQSIQAPTHVVIPEKGMIQNYDYLQKRLEWLSPTSQHVIPGEHHGHMLTNTPWFEDLIQQINLGAS